MKKEANFENDRKCEVVSSDWAGGVLLEVCADEDGLCVEQINSGDVFIPWDWILRAHRAAMKDQALALADSIRSQTEQCKHT